MNQDRPVFTVSDINQYIKALISSDENLKYIYVKEKSPILKWLVTVIFIFPLRMISL